MRGVLDLIAPPYVLLAFDPTSPNPQVAGDRRDLDGVAALNRLVH